MDLSKFWPSSNVLSKVNFLIYLGGIPVSSALLGSLRRLILISNIYNNPTHDVVCSIYWQILIINIYSLFNVKRINETLISNNDWNIINNNVLK